MQKIIPSIPSLVPPPHPRAHVPDFGQASKYIFPQFNPKLSKEKLVILHTLIVFLAVHKLSLFQLPDNVHEKLDSADRLSIGSVCYRGQRCDIQ